MMKMSFWLVSLALAAGAAMAQDDECPPIDGSCQVTLESLIEVSYYGFDDELSCPFECASVPQGECRFYTEYIDPYNERLRKCLLFNNCNIVVPCDDCVTTPVDPDYCAGTGSTCDADKDNVVDLFYFALQDTFNCPKKCEDVPECNFWTQFTVEVTGSLTNKCFLYRDCQNTQPCIDCISGSN